MNIAYSFIRQAADSQIDKIIRLYQTAGWWTGQAHENHELIRRIVTGSHCFNHPDAFQPAYLRYFERALRERFGFEGIPVCLDISERTKKEK